MRWGEILVKVLERGGGLATRQALLAEVPTTVLDGFVGRRTLSRVLPHVYCRAGAPMTDELLLRAALLHAGPVAALSHNTALAVWGLIPLQRPLHLTVDQSVRRVGARDVVIHRRLHFRPEAPQVVVRRQLPITALPRTLVDSWPLLPLADRRPLLLDTARRGLVVPKDLLEALTERPNVGGHRALAQTVDLIADGCQSELEAHGVLDVFRHRSLPKSVGQHRLVLPDRTVKLDRAWPEVKMAVELDGARHHTSPEDRQRDLARDRALAALGWIVLRFTYADVLGDPDGVRRRVLEVYAARAAQLRVS